RSAGGDFAAGVAGVVGLSGRPILAIQSLREDARGSCLAHAADARKNIRVCHAIRLNGVGKRARHMLLPDNFGERLRAIFASDDFVGHGKAVSGEWYLVGGGIVIKLCPFNSPRLPDSSREKSSQAIGKELR